MHLLRLKLLTIAFWTWLLAWPIKPEWIVIARQTTWDLSGAAICPSKTACYTDGIIHLNLYSNTSGRSLRDQYLHEMQHHFQDAADIAERPGGYNRFLTDLSRVVYSGRYTDEHQLATMKAMLKNWEPEEAHADLPLLLDGEIPPELADWYPWFDLSKDGE